MKRSFAGDQPLVRHHPNCQKLIETSGRAWVAQDDIHFFITVVRPVITDFHAARDQLCGCQTAISAPNFA